MLKVYVNSLGNYVYMEDILLETFLERADYLSDEDKAFLSSLTSNDETVLINKEGIELLIKIQ